MKPGLPRTFDDGWDKRWVTGAAGDKSLGEWKHTAGEYYGGDEAAAKDLFKTIESLDFAIRSKDLDAATPLVADAASKADAILASF